MISSFGTHQWTQGAGKWDQRDGKRSLTRGVTVEFRVPALSLSVRYGLASDVLDEEKARLLELARLRALSGAWLRAAAAGAG